MRVRGYAICGAPWSGSDYLCSLLRSTNLLGQPREYFNTLAMRPFFQANYPDDPELQLNAMTQCFMTANGVYGLKVFTAHFDRVSSNRWAERLPQLSFVFLTRRDLLGQAISFVHALQTGGWSTLQGEASTPRYDPAQIGTALASLAEQESRWRYFFARNGVSALNLVYEDVVAAPEAAVRAIAELMDVPDLPQIDIGHAKLGVQRDETNREWRARFLVDSRRAGRAQ